MNSAAAELMRSSEGKGKRHDGRAPVMPLDFMEKKRMSAWA
jgi:hypothetical protein